MALSNPSADAGSPAIGLALFARNEAANLEKLTLALSQEEEFLATFSLVVDGSNDGSGELAWKLAEENPEISVQVSELARGKWTAIQEFCHQNQELLHTRGVLLMAADLRVPAGFVEGFAKVAHGQPGPLVLGARVVPLNLPTGFGRVVHVLWAIHHAAAMLKPRAGEVIFFKGNFPELSNDLVVDEPAIYQFVRAVGGRVEYLSDVCVFNLGPGNFKEFLNRRRSITGGYLQLRQKGLGERYTPGENLKLLGLIVKWLLKGNPVGRLPVMMACLVEALARMLGFLDLKRGRLSQHWQPAPSTKSFEGTILSEAAAQKLQEGFFQG